MNVGQAAGPGGFNTPGESCWPGANANWTANPCDHFGVSTTGNVLATRYSWVVQASPGAPLVSQLAAIPAVVYRAPAPGQRKTHHRTIADAGRIAIERLEHAETDHAVAAVKSTAIGMIEYPRIARRAKQGVVERQRRRRVVGARQQPVDQRLRRGHPHHVLAGLAFVGHVVGSGRTGRLAQL